MFFADPQRTSYDLNFRLFGVPVRVHPFFWLAMVLLGTNSDTTPKEALIWVIAAFISILVHEFGHVAAITYFGARAHIVLHGFGGLAIDETGRRRTPQQQVIISLAGPAAGFLLIGLVVLAIRLSGSPTVFRYYPPISFGFGFRSLGSDMLNGLVSDLWFANVYWGLLNLLPVYPLDGGQATAALFQWKDPHDGLRKALTLSFGTAVLLVAYAVLNGGGFSFIAIFFGFLAYQNYQLLQALRGRYGGSPW